jgi:protein-S-isoprenylcysteine O-methyltransferase Ste14
MILSIAHFWILGLWIVFLIYWAIAATFIKAGVGRVLTREGIAIRLAFAAAIIIAITIARRFPEFRTAQLAEFHSAAMAIAGAIIATVGAAFAFAARAAIGRNWATPATRRTDTELVTTGPYRLVRHPIYSGILLMMIGTAVGIVPAWWFLVVFAGAYFIYSARREEQIMADRFPDTYPAYRARTKMLLPFIL